jgi:hypothetical protein
MSGVATSANGMKRGPNDSHFAMILRLITFTLRKTL